MASGFFLLPSVAESVNQRRHREYISGLLLHRGAQCHYAFVESFLLQQHQPEAKIKLVPAGLERDRLLDLFGGLSKLRTRLRSEGYRSSSAASEQRTIFERLVLPRERASHQGGFPTDHPVLRTNQR